MAKDGKRPARHINYCLLCKKPQSCLPTHLARVCMKGKSPEERKAELERSKDSMRGWTRQARNWDYNEMCQIFPHRQSRLALLEELQRRHFFVANAPHPNDLEPTTEPRPAADRAANEASLPSDGDTDAGEEEESIGSHSSRTRDPTWQPVTDQATTSVRSKMQSSSLYKKFPPTAKLLSGFKNFLRDIMCARNPQQEVDNVSRMLRFIQDEGEEVELTFLLQSTRTLDFLSRLKETKMSPATRLNYIKSMLRFIKYLKTLVEFSAEDPDFIRKCQTYYESLTIIKTGIAKESSNATCSKRWTQYTEGMRSVSECQEILRVAKKDILNVRYALDQGKPVTVEQKTMYRYYCEAILILGYFQRPAVADYMTVTEWQNRIREQDRVRIGITSHNAEATQLVTFALTQEEEALLEAYYSKIRKHCVNEDVDDEGRFFLGSSGKPIRSSTNDLQRLHAHYKVKNTNSREIRQVLRMNWSVAKAAYRPTPSQTVRTISLLNTLVSSTSDELPDEGTSRCHKRRREESEQLTLTDFIKKFPPTIEGMAPKKAERVAAGFPEDRSFYDKWRTQQLALRQDYVLSQCRHRLRIPPTAARVQKILTSEKWAINVPDVESIITKWKPPTRTDVENNQYIIDKITKQNWSGLCIKFISDKEGRGVVATKDFAKGAVICDYHGKLVTKAEGQRITLSGSQDNRGYCFFFKNFCIDATTSPCECHPSLPDTIGRRMNHSRKKFNVKPKHCRVKFPDGERDTILLLANKDIKVDDQLKFDYGVRRRDFIGEGLDLEWQDE